MKTTLTAIWLLLIVTACSPEIAIHTDYDPDYNVSAYHSFTWALDRVTERGKNPLYFNELNDKRIRAAIDEQMANKGYMKTTINPGLVLHYHIIVEDKTAIATDPYGYYGPYWRRMGTYAYQYRQGTLVVDMIDANSNSLIWRGWAVSAIDDSYTPERSADLIKTAVAKIFKKFPGAAGNSKPIPIVSN